MQQEMKVVLPTQELVIKSPLSASQSPKRSNSSIGMTESLISNSSECVIDA